MQSWILVVAPFSLALFAAFIFLGYLSWAWTGFGQTSYPKTEKTGENS